MFSVQREDFGAGFAFGVATAAYQIEGGQVDGRGSSIWDSFSGTPGNTKHGETGRDACDHYRRWPEDLDLIKVIDDPKAVVQAIFDHYEGRGFAPSAAEREIQLSL